MVQGEGRDWKLVWYKTAMETLGGGRWWLPWEAWCFPDVKTRVWQSHSFHTYPPQTQEPMWILKHIHKYMIYAFCPLHNHPMSELSTCLRLPKLYWSNHTQYLWDNTVFLSSLSKSSLKFKVIHKKKKKCLSFSVCFLSCLQGHIYCRGICKLVFPQGNQCPHPGNDRLVLMVDSA